MKAEDVHKNIQNMNKKINDIIAKETHGVHFGGYRELLGAIASIEEFYDLSYAPEAESKRSDIANIMINAMLENQTIDQISHSIESKGLNKDDAFKVAFTEDRRIKNLADWNQYFGAGYQFFSAECAENACAKCIEVYGNEKKYSIEQLNMLPPLHSECQCDLTFHRK